MVDFKGYFFLKSDEASQADFEAIGAEKDNRMPYFSISDEVMDDQDTSIFLVNKSMGL